MSKRSQTNTLFNYFKSPTGPKKDDKSTAKPAQSPKPSTPKRPTKGKGKVNGKENKKDNKKGVGTPKRKRPEKDTSKKDDTNKDEDEEDKNVEEAKTKRRKIVKENIKDNKMEGVDSDEEVVEQVKTKRGRVVKKRMNAHVDDDDDDDSENEGSKKQVPAANGKKRRIIIPEDSSGTDDDDYKPDPDETITESDITEGVPSSDPETDTEDDPTPQKNKKNGFFKGKSKTPRSKKNNDDKGYVMEKAELVTGPASGSDSWPHLKLDFLQPEKIRDAQKRRPDDPKYDSKTVFVPPEFLNNQTPAMRQWWVLKSQHYDCVFFFKVGKFYELYHMDAVTGVNALGLTFMRGEWAHSGFPEISYGRFSSTLVEKGYKVARIEQTENPEMMAKRVTGSTSKITKFDKVVRREICQISTRGTRVATVQDTECFAPHSNYLLSIVEKLNSTQLPTYGICFIDTSIGVFHLGQFEDDRHNSRLLTLLSHSSPAHLIYEKGGLSPATMKIFNTQLPATTIKETLLKETEFLSAAKVLEKLHEGDYFKRESSEFMWPEGLKPFLNEKDALGLTPAGDKELAVNALGGVFNILCSYMLDQQLLAQKKFQTFVPPDMNYADDDNPGILANMVLDAVAINNLNVLGKSPSLISTLDYCCTPFAKRLLKEWICRPAGTKKVILSRQEAITELCDFGHVVQEVKEILASVPDLERLLSKIHTHGNAAKVKNHPDGRAFMYEPQTYSKRKISDFVTTLEGFENILKIMEKFQALDSELIVRTTQMEPRGEFPNLRETLDIFKKGFNHEAALKEGCIVPKKGMDEEYDAVMDKISNINKDADKYLKEQCKQFRCTVKFSGNGKNRYQLEVPESEAKKAGDGYALQGQRKGYKRFSTDETVELLSRQVKAEEQREKVLKDSDRRTFAKFSENYNMWSFAIYKVAVIDVLISLAEYAKTGDMCIPEITESDGIMIAIRNGKHPFITSDNFVPNDTSLATDDYGPLMILTGPNMGGKSTIMRQVGLLMIMAQIGCHIPAESCKFSVIDRVFTRLGANDDMVTGRSTFLVELSEAATVVQHATKHSLTLIDELGRGTSTHDGTAIAAAVLNSLAQLNCRTIFSTHYHSLVDDFKDNPNVSAAHMACLVESEENDESQETVTFLYKLTEGACPKSYGFNAARIAGIKPAITKRANDLASQLEQAGKRRNLFISLCNTGVENVKNILTQLQAIKIQ